MELQEIAKEVLGIVRIKKDQNPHQTTKTTVMKPKNEDTEDTTANKEASKE